MDSVSTTQLSRGSVAIDGPETDGLLTVDGIRSLLDARQLGEQASDGESPLMGVPVRERVHGGEAVL